MLTKVIAPSMAAKAADAPAAVETFTLAMDDMFDEVVVAVVFAAVNPPLATAPPLSNIPLALVLLKETEPCCAV